MLARRATTACCWMTAAEVGLADDGVGNTGALKVGGQWLAKKAVGDKKGKDTDKEE